jgi:hypothetical protein
MAKQATNKVSTIKLPDGKHTQTGKRTLKEMYRVHFPDSKLTDDSGEGCGHITNRGEWNMAKQVINQSKIRWALGTFKPFTSVGTDRIVPARLQQGVEHLVPRLCHILRAFFNGKFWFWLYVVHLV